MEKKSIPVLIFLFLTFFSFLNLARVSGSPGISVDIVVVDAFAGGVDDEAFFVVRVESITVEDENVKLIVSGHSSLSFNWTVQEFVLTLAEVKEFPLMVNVAIGTGAGDYEFMAFGEAWPTWLTYDEAVSMGLIETSSYTDYIHVTTTITPPLPPSVTSCDQFGNVKTTFLPHEDVYARGSGYPPSKEVAIYVIPDGYAATPGNAKAVAHKVTEPDGTLAVTLVWMHLLEIGKYDIWVDVNLNEVYDQGDVWNNEVFGVYLFNVIPDFPVVGTAGAATTMLIGLGLFLHIKRRQP